HYLFCFQFVLGFSVGRCSSLCPIFQAFRMSIRPRPRSSPSLTNGAHHKALWEEPTEAISQKPARGRRNPLPSGRGGCQKSIGYSHLSPALRNRPQHRCTVATASHRLIPAQTEPYILSRKDITA